MVVELWKEHYAQLGEGRHTGLPLDFLFGDQILVSDCGGLVALMHAMAGHRSSDDRPLRRPRGRGLRELPGRRGVCGVSGVSSNNPGARRYGDRHRASAYTLANHRSELRGRHRATDMLVPEITSIREKDS